MLLMLHLLTSTSAYSQASGVVISFEVKENNSWRSFAASSSELLAPLAINCQCQQSPFQLALRASFGVQDTRKDLILVGDTPEQPTNCPSEVALIALLDTVTFKGTLRAELRSQGQAATPVAVFAGYLYEANKDRNSAEMRVAVRDLSGNPTTSCPEANPAAPAGGSQGGLPQGGASGGAQRAGVSASFNQVVASRMAASRAGLAAVLAQWRENKDPVGRTIPASDFCQGLIIRRSHGLHVAKL